MGKTLGRILVIGAAIAANFVPVVGTFLGAALTTAITSAGVATALTVAAGVLGLGPSAPKPATAETAIKRRRRYSALTISDIAEQ